MKRNSSVSLHPPFLIVAVLAVIMAVGGCHRKEVSRLSDEVSAINDTLRKGNVDVAVRMTEELKAKSLKEGDSAIWSECMVQQAVNSYYQNNPDLLLASTDTALNWLERQRPSRELARVLARAYQSKGAYYDQYFYNPDSTAHYLRLSVDNVERSGIKSDLPQAYGNYANAMRLGASLDSAAIYYHRAINLADSLGMSNDNYIPLYNGIAAVLTDMRDFDNSRIWWNKSLEILDDMNQFDKFNTLTGYGNDLYYRRDYPEANKLFIKLRRMLDSVPGSRWEQMFTDVNMADTYIRLGHTREAVDILDSTARYFSLEQPNPTVKSYIHTLQMRAAIKAGDLGWASYLAKMYPVSDTLRLEQLLARLEVLEELHKVTGNPGKAYEMRCRFDLLNDSLRSNKIRQLISTLNAIYQRDNRILNLEAANTLQQARIYRLFAAVAFAVAVIATLILILMVRRGRVRRQEEKMMRKIMTLRRENLRNRITPHFICNALNHELNNSSEGKTLHLDSLVHLIRRQQYVSSEILIPFSEELSFVDDYIGLIGEYGRGPLDYSHKIDPAVSPDFLFPAMALQILVENAFKHGFSSLPAGEVRHLIISVELMEDGHISVAVFNNASESGSHSESGGTGLRVLVETIRLINERNKEKIEFSINIDSRCGDLHGCSAVIIIPQTLKF